MVFSWSCSQDQPWRLGVNGGGTTDAALTDSDDSGRSKRSANNNRQSARPPAAEDGRPALNPRVAQGRPTQPHRRRDGTGPARPAARRSRRGPSGDCRRRARRGSRQLRRRLTDATDIAGDLRRFRRARAELEVAFERARGFAVCGSARNVREPGGALLGRHSADDRRPGPAAAMTDGQGSAVSVSASEAPGVPRPRGATLVVSVDPGTSRSARINRLALKTACISRSTTFRASTTRSTSGCRPRSVTPRSFVTSAASRRRSWTGRARSAFACRLIRSPPTRASSRAFGNLGGTSTAVGDMSIYGKYILLENRETGTCFPAGLAITAPTGPGPIRGL